MRLGEPHGGKLIDRRVDTRKKPRLEKEAKEMPSLPGNERILSDCWQIAIGGFSPLEGFLTRDDYISVIENARLASGIIWSFPVVLPVPEKFCKQIEEGDAICITEDTKPIAMVSVEEIYERDKGLEIRKFFNVEDTSHPGVQKVLEEPNYLIGGKITLINVPSRAKEAIQLEPKETREEFRRRGWKIIVAFQTRNIPHMAHEYLQRIGLEICDGLFIHPIIGERKPGDFPPQAIIEAYNWITNNLYPREKVLLSFLWTWMRFAGPREALHHCLVRKNYGATHHIIGRLHASPAGYYPEYATHDFLRQFDIDELGIQPLLLHGPFYCKKCGMIATDSTCGHSEENRIQISMTFIRRKLREGKIDEIPSEIIRKEILQIAMKYIDKIS